MCPGKETSTRRDHREREVFLRSVYSNPGEDYRNIGGEIFGIEVYVGVMTPDPEVVYLNPLPPPVLSRALSTSMSTILRKYKVGISQLFVLLYYLQLQSHCRRKEE